MSTTTETAPELFVLFYRAYAKGARWKKAGTFASRAEALTHCRGAGDFQIKEEPSKEKAALEMKKSARGDGRTRSPDHRGPTRPGS